MEVEELLAAHEMAGGILAADLGSLARGVEPAGRHRRIGRYRVLREIGRGGMGVVYLAERDDGQFRRLVAIKLLRDGPDADELRTRFTAERHILAFLDHDNIAQLLDAGVTDGELPYLVMEYVDGLPITTYCDRHRLDLRARLLLFQEVCAAVHHAHRNLVIHRDLKPGNILVTDRGEVKLLDFGIAKLQNPGLGGVHFPVTRTQVRVMTPEYASPEQARGEGLSTASDLYSLGVVLYELLTGRRPFDFDSITHEEVARRLAEQEPERPSSAVFRAPADAEGPAGGDARATAVKAAAARDTTPERLRRALTGDLDAIVMMALRKESSRRYGSADLFAEDIHRWLEGLPVLAHRGSRRYYAGKFLRRHRAAAAAAAIVGTSVVSAAGIAFWQASLARGARDRAEAARSQAERALTESEAVTGFLVGLFEASDPQESGGREVTAQDILRRGTARIEALSDRPLVQARVLEAVARVYQSLGQQNEARALFERAVANRRVELGADDPEVARTLALLADVIRLQGRYVEAEAKLKEALDIQERVLGPNDLDVAETLARLSGLAIYRGDLATAEALSRRSLAIRESNPSASDSLRVAGMVHLATVIQRVGEYDEAERYLRRGVAMMEKHYGADHPATSFPMRYLALELEGVGRLDEAEGLLRRVLDIEGRASGGAARPNYAYAIEDLAVVRSLEGDHRTAAALFEQYIQLLRQVFGSDYDGVAEGLGALSEERLRLGELGAAEHAAREALVLARQDVGEDHQLYADLLARMAAVLQRQHRYTEAEASLRRAIDIRSRANGPGTRTVGLLRAQLGAFLLERRRFAEAEAELTAALSIVERSLLPETDERFQLLLTDLLDLYERWGRPEEAAPYRARLRKG
jgi:eukaryotic-like serine/threonine-protein kinase